MLQGIAHGLHMRLMRDANKSIFLILGSIVMNHIERSGRNATLSADTSLLRNGPFPNFCDSSFVRDLFANTHF